MIIICLDKERWFYFVYFLKNIWDRHRYFHCIQFLLLKAINQLLILWNNVQHLHCGHVVRFSPVGHEHKACLTCLKEIACIFLSFSFPLSWNTEVSEIHNRLRRLGQWWWTGKPNWEKNNDLVKMTYSPT